MILSELLKEEKIIVTNAEFNMEISGIAYDSRNVKPGDAFVAIKGFQSDGHVFIPLAWKSGASIIICETIPDDSSVKYVCVRNTRHTLALISCAFFNYPAQEMKIIGVTGTNGKTTTTHLIKHMLEQMTGEKVGMVGTNGNYIGTRLIHTEHTTPESYELQKLFREMRDDGCAYAVMEVSSHSLELKRVDGITFDVAVFTNLTQDHLDFHETMENYAAAKKIIFSRCRCGWINADDDWADYMHENIIGDIKVFSAEDSEADLHASDISLTASDVSFDANYMGNKARTVLHIPGLFSVHNALSAISVCLSLGFSLSKCSQALSSAHGVKGRVETVPTGRNFSVIIDYSHTPDSLENILRTLRPVTEHKLICVFGCGGDRDRKKRPIMGKIASDNSDLCIVTSDNPRTEDPIDIINDILAGIADNGLVEIIPDRIEAINYALDIAEAGDIVLLAGKGHEDYQVIGHVKHHMDEREIVARHLKN